MSKGIRFTEEAWRQIAAGNTRWQRGTMLPVVGEANAQDSAGPPRVEGGASQETGRSEPKSTVVARDKYRSGQPHLTPALVVPPLSQRSGAGEANAQDAIRDMPCESCGRDLSDGHIHAAAIPTLTDAVAGPGLTKRPYKRRKASAVPYFQQLTALLRPLGIPDPIPELRFDAKRRWRFDFAWNAPVKLALELQGGLFSGGRHTRGAALLREYEKHNAATLAGWRVFYFAPDQLTQAADLVAEVFGR